MSNHSHSPTAAIIRQALGVLTAPGSVVEIRIPGARTRSGYFDDLDLAAAAAAKLNGTSSVYQTLNPCDPALLARAANRIIERPKATTSDRDILRRMWFPIDYDPVRPSQVSSTDVEHEAAIARAREVFGYLRSEGWPEPLVADSGNGAHLLYRIALPNDAESAELLKRCLQALALRFGDGDVSVDEKVFNAARIWKVYGTTACKGDNTPERPHRQAKLLRMPDELEVVSLVKLTALADTAPKPSQGDATYSRRERFDLDRWISDHGLDVADPIEWSGGRRWIFRVCPWNEEHRNRSAYIVQFSSGAIAAGCHHNGCNGKGWAALRAMYEPEYREAGHRGPARADHGPGGGTSNGSSPGGLDGGEAKEKKSAATALVELAEELYDFGVSSLGETFALPKTSPKVVAMLRGSKTSLRGQLARIYFTRHRRAAPQQALADALLVVDGLAQEKEEVELYLRVARHDGALWLDLGDQTGRAIRITDTGWMIKDEPPVLFRRTILTGALPKPVSGGSLNELWQRLNVVEADKPLLVAWLVAGLFHDIPHPVLAFFGEQGTGKTTAMKLLVSAIDPSPVPTRKPPRDADAWVTAASGSWIVGIDNMSEIQPWLSDSICRAVTGDGDVRRKLYTDGEHAVFAYRRCVCLTSIDLGTTRGDLSERMLPIHLEVIPHTRRIRDEVIWAGWYEALPAILGAILDLAASVEKELPFVERESMPRMADFARVLAAVDKVLGTDGLARYLSSQNALAADSLEGDPFISAIEAHGAFKGTAAELLNKITPDKPPKGWPATPRAATQRLRRHSPAMRKIGWTVEDDGGRNHTNSVRWDVSPPSRAKKAGNSDSQYAQDSQGTSPASPASHENEQSQDDYAHTEVVL